MIYKFIKILTHTKFYIKKPYRKKILIYDRTSAEEIKEFFENKEDIFVLDTRKETINLFVILKLIFKFKKINFRNYLKTYIELIDPKAIITFIDNNIFFYELKKYFQKKIFISIQNGFRFAVDDMLDDLIKKKEINKEYKSDKYFVMNNVISKELGKYIRSDFVTIGSIRNNKVKINLNNIEKNTVCYVSRFSGIFKSYTLGHNLNYLEKNFSKSEWIWLNFCIDLLKNTSKFCKKNNLQLKILVKSIRESDLEKKFCKKILGNDQFAFLDKDNVLSNYYYLDKMEVIVNTMSTLGYEALGRKKKVAFFSDKKMLGANFGWPEILDEKGFFFSNSNSYEEVERVISNLRNIKNDEWLSTVENYIPVSCYYNYQNTILKNFLKTL